MNSHKYALKVFVSLEKNIKQSSLFALVISLLAIPAYASTPQAVFIPESGGRWSGMWRKLDWYPQFSQRLPGETHTTYTFCKRREYGNIETLNRTYDKAGGIDYTIFLSRFDCANDLGGYVVQVSVQDYDDRVVPAGVSQKIIGLSQSLSRVLSIRGIRGLSGTRQGLKWNLRLLDLTELQSKMQCSITCADFFDMRNWRIVRLKMFFNQYLISSLIVNFAHSAQRSTNL